MCFYTMPPLALGVSRRKLIEQRCRGGGVGVSMMTKNVTTTTGTAEEREEAEAVICDDDAVIVGDIIVVPAPTHTC